VDPQAPRVHDVVMRTDAPKLALVLLLTACGGRDGATQPEADATSDTTLVADADAGAGADDGRDSASAFDAFDAFETPDATHEGCAARTCASAGAACGCLDDGCGHVLDCGDCASGGFCGGGGVPNVCGGIACVPVHGCAVHGVNCGPVSDGCGGILDCGTCGGGAPCVLNRCAPPDGGCVPRTCAQARAECGTADDGCGGPLDCGACAAGAACGYLTANRCWVKPVCGGGDGGPG
jgi:hypothetical protein